MDENIRKQYEKLLKGTQRQQNNGQYVPASVPKTSNYRAASNTAVPSAAAPSTAPSSPPVYTPTYTGRPTYTPTAGDRPTYLGTYDQQLADLYGAITSRPEFSYDATKDPLYQQYKDQYIQGGKLAMRDTMGQAAGLTGGYGSTYGQQVGQQAYDAYLQKLGEVVPELYNSAYNKYADEGNRLLQQYSLLSQQQQDEYGRYRDDLSDWERAQQQEYDRYRDELTDWARAQQEEYQRYQDEYDRWWQQQQWDASQDDRQYDRQHDAYTALYSIIGAAGYIPTDAELEAAGMTREAAEALRQEYLRATGQLEQTGTGGGGGYGGGGSGGGSGTSGTEDEDDQPTDEEIREYLALIQKPGRSGGGNTRPKPWSTRIEA